MSERITTKVKVYFSSTFREVLVSFPNSLQEWQVEKTFDVFANDDDFRKAITNLKPDCAVEVFEVGEDVGGLFFPETR